jgi:hypothetical protein
MADLTQPIPLQSAASEARPAPAPAPASAGQPEPEATGPSRRASELALALLFLLVIAAVPVGQTWLDLARHQRVQFADVFRYRPTARNLRQYEETLKEKSWFQQKLRPAVQRLLFATLHDTGAKGVLGRDHWLFYRPDLRYMVEPNRLETDNPASKWAPVATRPTQRQSVVRAIARFRDQLNERGIALVVVPVPGKPSVYPDQLTRRKAARPDQCQSPTIELLKALDQEGIATVNLFAVFRQARLDQATNGPLYLARDTHWTPLGARLAAGAVAARLRALGRAPAAAKEFRTQTVPVRRWGDVLEMMQIPGLREAFAVEEVACEQVLDPVRGLLLPASSDRPGAYRAAGQGASVLVLGDSFCRIYQYAEPASLGEVPAAPGASATKTEDRGSKRLLPGSAGFISHLALALKAPVDAIYSDGGASTDVRRKLSTNPEMLEGKRVVVWEFVERDVALGAQGWEDVPLPAKLD